MLNRVLREFIKRAISEDIRNARVAKQLIDPHDIEADGNDNNNNTNIISDDDCSNTSEASTVAGIVGTSAPARFTQENK